MGYSSQFDKVRCSVDVDPAKMIGIFDRAIVQRDLTHVAANIIRSYGVEVEELPPGSMGGGLESFIELLKFAWQHKDILALVATIYSFAKAQLKRIADSSLNEQRPHLVVFLSIGSDDPLDEEKHPGLPARIKMLKLFADAICVKLKQDYPVFLYDQSIGVSFRPNSFSVNFRVRHENISNFNTWRLYRVANVINLSRSQYYNYGFGKMLITATRGHLKATSPQGWSRSGKHEKRYAFISGRIW